MRNATSESWRISLSVSCDTPLVTLHSRACGRLRGNPGDMRRLRGCFCFQVLVRRAVVALRQRRALARLALACRRAAACDAAVERAGLDLLLDELCGRLHALLHGPRHLGLAGDREVTPDVLEERPVRLREIERIVRETLHRLLAGHQHCATRLELGFAVSIWIDHVLDRPIYGTRVLIHAVLQLEGPLFDHSLVSSYEVPAKPLLTAD